MRSVRRILVAVKDCEAKSTPALVKAAQLAKACGARLELFHGISMPLYVDGSNVSDRDVPQMEQTFRARILTQLEAIADNLRRDDINVTVAAEWDFPAYEAIVRHAYKSNADLVVADQHTGRHTAAGLLHLTDWELLRLCPVPVLLVKTSGVYREPVVLAAVDPRHTFSKPVKLDQQILTASATLAEALQGTQHALHAYVPYPVAAGPETVVTQESIDQVQEEAAAAARKALDQTLRTSRIPLSQRHVVGRRPADAIAQTARQIHTSIVVMGALSRSGLKRLFIGNTAERTLDLLTCDVLIVKPQRFANRVPLRRRGARVVPFVSTALPL